MTPDEFTARMGKYGVDYNKRTLFNHTAAGCIPEPQRGAGYGGKWAEYREIDIIWAITAYRLIHGIMPSRNADMSSVNVLDEVKPPRIPPKTVGLIHKELLKCFREYKQQHAIEDIEELERFLCEHCFNTMAGSTGLLLRNIAAWYVFTLDGVIVDMAVINTKNGGICDSVQNGTAKQMTLFLGEYQALWNRFSESIPSAI